MLKLPKPFRKQGQQLCSDGNTAVFFDAYNVDHMHDAYQQGLAEQPERAPLSCTWTQEDDFDMPGVYHTSCSEMWSFTEGGIKENNTKFCPHCGGGIKQGGQND